MTYLPNRRSKARFRRLVKRPRRRVLEVGEQAEQEFDRLFFKRLTRLIGVRRFISGWIMLVVILIAGVILQGRGLSEYYQALSPVRGGVFREGVIGSFTNANPIYSTGTADATVSQLVFSSLLTYNTDNQLIGDLAESWTSDERGQVYTVKIRPGVKWHDEVALTADDVLFTYQTIQNPDARSPLFSSWQGVEVTSPDRDTIVFTLPTPLAGFAHSLTNGIIPRHLLSGIPVGQLRSTPFSSTAPVGSGPFKFSSVEVFGSSAETRQEQISLTSFDKYFLGRPALDGYVLRVFRDQSQLAMAFDNHEINAAIGLSPTEVPVGGESVNAFSVPLTSAVYAFLNNSSEILADAKVRQALAHTTDADAILEKIGYPLVAVRQPILRSQGGYDPALDQRKLDLATAENLLNEAGWVRPDGSQIRKKGDQPLRLRLFSQSLAEYAIVVQTLQAQWQQIGVEVEAVLQSEEDLQTGVIARHDYDVLLYGIAIGSDADVFAYWHSSQADPRSQNRLNLSEYKSTVADEALEAGRTRIDPSLRTVKYRAFLEAWRNDVPAIGLYQPRFYYVIRGELAGFEGKIFNSATDRFNNVVNWMIRQEPTLR